MKKRTNRRVENKIVIGKKYLIFPIIILFLLLFFIGFIIWKNRVGKSYESKMEEIKYYQNMIIYNINVEETKLEMTIQNTSGKDFEQQMVILYFKDKEGKILGKTEAFIPRIEKNQKMVFTIVIPFKAINAYNFEIK